MSELTGKFVVRKQINGHRGMDGRHFGNIYAQSTDETC